MNHQDVLEEFEQTLRCEVKRLDRETVSWIDETDKVKIAYIKQTLDLLMDLKAKHSRNVPYPKYCTLKECEGKNSCQRDPNCCD